MLLGFFFWFLVFSLDFTSTSVYSDNSTQGNNCSTRTNLIMTNALPVYSSSERSRLLSVGLVRRRALERLYSRKAAVDDLIQSLETYQQSRDKNIAPCIEFSVARRCLSDSSQSQI